MSIISDLMAFTGSPRNQQQPPAGQPLPSYMYNLNFPPIGDQTGQAQQAPQQQPPPQAPAAAPTAPPMGSSNSIVGKLLGMGAGVQGLKSIFSFLGG